MANDLSIIPQIAIALTGVTAIWLTQSKSEDVRRYACIFGLVGQPFWFWSAIEAQQWGIVAMCCLYTLAWVKGVRTHWLKPKPAAQKAGRVADDPLYKLASAAAMAAGKNAGVAPQLLVAPIYWTLQDDDALESKAP